MQFFYWWNSWSDWHFLFSLLSLDDGAQLNLLKKAKRDLEQQLNELQEELDDTYAEQQAAEQSRDRLQVQNERDRQQFARDRESKDQEMEDLRHGFQKRIKQLEVQVEEEADERTRANNQRKEAEQKLQVKIFSM